MSAKSPSATSRPPANPLKPRRKLFWALMMVYVICIAGLVVMYYATVR